MSSPTSYRITGVIRDKQGRITDVQLDDSQIYPVDSIMKWIKDGLYAFYTATPENAQTPVSVRGKKFLITQGNKTKVDNLDFLPLPALV